MSIEVMPVEKALSADGAEAAAPASHAHMLPCEIEYSGEAIVSAYFKPEETSRGLEATFRGRALCGKRLSLPAGYVGAVLQDPKLAAIADGEDRRWLHRGTVEDITIWKHDEVPHEDEPVFKAMRFARLADVLHGDHSSEDDEPADA